MIDGSFSELYKVRKIICVRFDVVLVINKYDLLYDKFIKGEFW